MASARPIQMSINPMPEMMPRMAPLCSAAESQGYASIRTLWSHMRGHHGTTTINKPRYRQNITRTNKEKRCSQMGAGLTDACWGNESARGADPNIGGGAGGGGGKGFGCEGMDVCSSQ